MKITVEFLSLPNVVKKVGSKTVSLNISGTTVEDLIRELGAKYGKDVRQFLLDETGQLDMSFAVAINKEELIHRDQLNRALQDGDHVAIMMLVAGG
jgi:sulfur carrier protein ThiS